ncbi:MAG: hypothetical protein Q9187_002184 [Circinaria calcarea]
MAAPAEVTMKDLNGDWVMNKTLSDDLDPVLALQGLPWLLRKVVSWATITMHVKQYIDDVGITNIRIEQTATGGIKGETELRKLDWSEVPHVSGVFGEMMNHSRWSGVKQNARSGDGGTLDTFLTEGWLEEAAGTREDENHVQNWVVNKKGGWTAEQMWGFAMVDGKRYHVKKFLVKKGGEMEKVKMRTLHIPNPHLPNTTRTRTRNQIPNSTISLSPGLLISLSLLLFFSFPPLPPKLKPPIPPLTRPPRYTMQMQQHFTPRGHQETRGTRHETLDMETEN